MAAIVTVALLLTTHVMGASASPSVIIVGAGMSGERTSQAVQHALNLNHYLYVELLFLVQYNYKKCNPKTHITCLLIRPSISGISAAKTLSDAGIKDILILEATDHIGGRIHKTKFAGLDVELGANWVEGVNGDKMNPIWEMVKKLQLKTFYSDYTNVSSNTYIQGYISH